MGGEELAPIQRPPPSFKNLKPPRTKASPLCLCRADRHRQTHRQNHRHTAVINRYMSLTYRRTYNGKSKCKCHTLDIAKESHCKALMYGTRCRRIAQLPAQQPCVYPRMESTIPAFAFPAEAGRHLPTPEGWKAELTSALYTTMSRLNSLPRTATWQKPQLLAVQTVTPH